MKLTYIDKSCKNHLDFLITGEVSTEPDEQTIRIISLRKALSHERKRYEQYLKNRLG